MFKKALCTSAPQPPKLNDKWSCNSLLEADDLLSSKERQSILAHVHALFSELDYQQYYQELIARFAEFVQLLPSLDPSEKIIDEALERSLKALNDYLKEIYPAAEDFRNLSTKEMAWVYAVYTSALFSGLGPNLSRYRVMLCTSAGEPIQVWEFLEGAMLGKGPQAYRFELKSHLNLELGQFLDILLARQIMDEIAISRNSENISAFTWLAHYEEAFIAWLEVMKNPSENIAMQIAAAYTKAKEPVSEHISAHVPAKDTSDIVENFLTWLECKVKNGQADLDSKHSPIYRSAEGFLLNARLLEEFSAVFPIYSVDLLRRKLSLELSFSSERAGYMFAHSKAWVERLNTAEMQFYINSLVELTDEASFADTD